MTTEQKAKLYDSVIKERDAYRHLVAEFLSTMSSACFNGFDEAWKDHKTGKPIKTSGRKPEEISNDLRFKTRGDFHDVASEIARLLDIVKVAGAKLDEMEGKKPAELEALLPDVIDIKNAYKEAHHWDTKPTKAELNRLKLSPEDLAHMLVTFYMEYQFGHVYPGDENSIYQEVFQRIMSGALANIGVFPDRESIIEWSANFKPKWNKPKR